MPAALIQILKLPLWLLSVITEAKSFADNPVIGNPHLNRFGLHAARLCTAAALTRFRRFFLARHIDKHDREAFEQNGYIIKENFLPEAMFEALTREVFYNTWALREMRQGDTVTRRVPLDLDALPDASQLRKLLQDKNLRSLVRYAASTGGEPVFAIQAIFSEPGSKGDPQTQPHADTFHSNAKMWLFLEDVDEEDGPFAYVPQSHRLSPRRLTWEKEQSLSARKHTLPYHARGSFRVDAAALVQMSLPGPKRIAVRKNTLVIADTFGFHCRTPSMTTTCRVEIFGGLRRNPFLPWTGLHFLALPGFRNRTGSASIELAQAMKRFKLKKMPWRPVGDGRIKDPVRS